MEIVSVIFCMGAGLVLFLSGVSKFFSIQENVSELKLLNVLSTRLINVLSYFLPLLEIIIAICLIAYSKFIIVEIFAGILFLGFVFIHLDAVLGKKEEKCFCFGKFIKAKHGFGGLVQTFLLLISLIPSIVGSSANLYDIFTNSEHMNFALITFSSILWSIILIMSRRLMDEW